MKSVIPTVNKLCLLAAGVVQYADNEQPANSRALALGREYKSQPSKVTTEWRQKQHSSGKKMKKSHISAKSLSLLYLRITAAWVGLRVSAPVEVAKLPMINEEIYNKAGCHAGIPVVFFLVGWYMPLNKGMFRFGSSNPLELIQTLAVPISGEDVAVQSGYPPLPCCSGSRAQMGAWKLGRSIKWFLFLGALFSDEPTWQMAFGFRDFRSWKE